MNVGTICSRHLVAVSIGAPLAEVAALMRDRHVGAVVVLEGESDHSRVAGIITDRDIVRAQLTRSADLSSLSARDTMTAQPLVILENESIDSAIAHLRARGVRRAPVVTPDGHPVGLISTDDLLAHLAMDMMAMARIVARQAREERV